MDPVSILGVTAAASQLAQQGGKIIKLACELYTGSQDVPDSTRRHLAKIQQLIDLARLVMHNASLQRESMVAVLGSCLRRAEEFYEYLKESSSATGRFRKLQNAAVTIVREKRVVEFMAGLEREKSSLALFIAEIDSSLLYSVKLDVEQLAIVLPDISAKIDDLQMIIPSMRDNVETLLKLTVSIQIFGTVDRSRKDL